MAVASYNDLLARTESNTQNVYWTKNSITVIAGRAYSMWLAGGLPAAGTAPTTAVVPTRATTGALGQLNSISGTANRLLEQTCQGSSVVTVTLTLIDRLSHQGGLSAIVTGAQTTNMPTAALTRQTSGVGVMMGYEVYTAIGATGTTITASYTNQAGTSGQTTPATTFGGTNFNAASRIILAPLASGDTGVRAAANVNVVATTGTAGAFGVTLFYPLLTIPVDMTRGTDAIFNFFRSGWMPLLDDNSCLSWLVHANTNVTGALVGSMTITESG